MRKPLDDDWWYVFFDDGDPEHAHLHLDCRACLRTMWLTWSGDSAYDDVENLELRSRQIPSVVFDVKTACAAATAALR